MDITDTFQVCRLCPGLCKLDCPIYSATRDLRSSPDRLAWAGYSLLSGGDYDTLYNLEMCTGCGYCMEACPIHNKLPDAIFKARTFIQDVLNEKIPRRGYIEIKLDEYECYIALDTSLYNNIDSFREEGVGIIDTSQLYLLKSYGIDIKIMGDAPIYTEDLDVFKPNNTSIHPIVMYQLPKVYLDEYTLHIPCKARELKQIILNRTAELYGKPAKVLTGCSGCGGYFYRNYPELSEKVVRRFFRKRRGPILTLCIHTWEALSKMNYTAYTPLIVYTRGVSDE